MPRGGKVMRALSDPNFDFAVLQASPEDQRAEPTRIGVRARQRLVIGFYVISAPVATVAWLAALAWGAVKMVGYALP
jgi:hypothetical protein